MIWQQTEDHIIYKKSHSKSFKEGIGILAEEIELALQWSRPSILLAVHNSKTGSIDAQRSLEQLIVKRKKQVTHINVEGANPDVIRVMSETPNSGDMVFFVSGIGNADQVSGGKVYRALNIRRELLVEKSICVVFWLNGSEAANLPRLAPDFWSFRHRVVEFAPKHGTKKQSLPVGLFLWGEQIPWMEEGVQKIKKLEYYEEFLRQLPSEDSATVIYIDTILKLVQFSWLLNDLKKFSAYLKDGINFLEKYSIPQYQAGMLNAKGIGLYEEGNKKDASLHFAQALIYDPNNSAIMMNTGIAAYGLGKNRDSILTGKRAIKKDPGNFHLWRVLGYLFLSVGKIEDAVEAMTKAQDINPHSLDTYYSLAVCYYKNEQLAECAKELSKAEKISPPQNAIQQACAGILSGKTDEALAQLSRSLEKKEINQLHIQRDPNLHFLLDLSQFLTPN
jgi:tetratricopeptide (TPR) repeat protein